MKWHFNILCVANSSSKFCKINKKFKKGKNQGKKQLPSMMNIDNIAMFVFSSTAVC